MSIAPGITLALDASTYEGTVAVLRDGAVVAERSVAMRGENEERLMPAVHSAVAEAEVSIADIARVICGEGPGSFTSLRIAGSIAKGIAFGNGVPLFAVSSLALIVAGHPSLATGHYLAALDAMRGERYVALFQRGDDGTVAATGGVALAPAGDVPGLAGRDGATSIGPQQPLHSTPHARGVVRMLPAILRAGSVSLDGWEPAYGRLAEAQVKWEAAHGRPLGA